MPHSRQHRRLAKDIMGLWVCAHTFQFPRLGGILRKKERKKVRREQAGFRITILLFFCASIIGISQLRSEWISEYISFTAWSYWHFQRLFALKNEEGSTDFAYLLGILCAKRTTLTTTVTYFYYVEVDLSLLSFAHLMTVLERGRGEGGRKWESFVFRSGRRGRSDGDIRVKLGLDHHWKEREREGGGRERERERRMVFDNNFKKFFPVCSPHRSTEWRDRRKWIRKRK